MSSNIEGVAGVPLELEDASHFHICEMNSAIQSQESLHPINSSQDSDELPAAHDVRGRI